jgi:hypothetical protein
MAVYFVAVLAVALGFALVVCTAHILEYLPYHHPSLEPIFLHNLYVSVRVHPCIDILKISLFRTQSHPLTEFLNISNTQESLKTLVCSPRNLLQQSPLKRNLLPHPHLGLVRWTQGEMLPFLPAEPERKSRCLDFDFSNRMRLFEGLPMPDDPRSLSKSTRSPATELRGRWSLRQKEFNENKKYARKTQRINYSRPGTFVGTSRWHAMALFTTTTL